MTLKDYYYMLDESSPRTKLRDQIIEECGISYDTFYKWMKFQFHFGTIDSLMPDRYQPRSFLISIPLWYD